MATTYSNKFRSFAGRELQLNIIEYNRDSFEVQLINKNYATERGFRIKSIITLVFTYSAFIASISNRIFLVHALSLLTFLFLIFSTIELIQSERVLFVSEFALQIITEKIFSRKSSLFIPATNIQDVVINEVIDDFAVKHALIVRTKGSLCHTKPIIVIFKSLQPRIECLEIVYGNFLRKLDPIR